MFVLFVQPLNNKKIEKKINFQYIKKKIERKKTQIKLSFFLNIINYEKRKFGTRCNFSSLKPF